MAGTAWAPSFTAGQIIKASDVENRFDWIEGSFTPQSAGSPTTGAYDLGTITAYWRSVYCGGLNATTTANGVAIGTTTVANNSSTALEVAGSRAILLPRLTTVQRDALTAANGHLIYNSTDNKFQRYENGVWLGMGGTVFQTKARTALHTNSGTTQTALNIASGGGRINGIHIRNTSQLSAIRISVILDGVTILSDAGVGGGGNTAASLGPDALWHLGSSSNTAQEFYDNANTSSAAPDASFIGFDFASTAAIYVAAAAGTSSVYFTYAQIL